MFQVPQTQDLFSQETQTQTTTPTPTMPQTPGGTGFLIPAHCSLLTLKSDLNKIHNEIKAAATDVATIAGGVLFNETKKETTDLIQALRNRLTKIPVLRAMADTETHRANASQMNTENKDLKAQVKELKRELEEAKETLAALTGEEAQKEMSQDEDEV